MSSSSAASSQTIIDHIVLFKVKDNTDPTWVNAMVNGLNGLSSLEPVLHLSMGPLRRVKSSPFPFTHMLHGRYSSKDNLHAYSVHPSHVSMVKNNALICDDLMAVDWVADGVNGLISPPPGSAMRVLILKVKEDLAEDVKGEILGVIKGIGGKFEQITCGKNFSPARAKGYSMALLVVFSGLEELKAVDEMVNSQIEKVREYLDSVIIVDYVVPPAQS